MTWGRIKLCGKWNDAGFCTLHFLKINLLVIFELKLLPKFPSLYFFQRWESSIIQCRPHSQVAYFYKILACVFPTTTCRPWAIRFQLISERRKETRREAPRRSAQVASCYSHMWKLNNIITREVLTLAMWFIEEKIIIFDENRYSWRNGPAQIGPTRPVPGPARPGPAMTVFDGLFLKCG